MKKLIQTSGALFLGLLSANSAFAKSDFDNSEIPTGAVVGFAGGCGTVIKFEPVTNIKPRYTDRRPGQGQIGGAGSGGDIAQALSIIPGVGLVAAAVGGAVSAIVANAAIDSANKQIDENSVKEQRWEKVYLVTIKPDFGDEYTIPYEKLNQRDPDIGSRVIVKSAAFYPNSPDKFVMFFAGDKDFGEPGTEKYLKSCYASYSPGLVNPYPFRQLSYNGTEFEWKKLDPKIQPSADAYFTKKAAEEAQKKADAAEAAKYNESR